MVWVWSKFIFSEERIECVPVCALKCTLVWGVRTRGQVWHGSFDANAVFCDVLSADAAVDVAADCYTTSPSRLVPTSLTMAASVSL